MNVYSELKVAFLENLAADPTTELAQGRTYFNTATNEVRVYDGAAWRVQAALDVTQIITNKDIDGGTASDTSRLTIPKGTKAALDALTRKEGTIVYATDLAKFFIDDGTALVEVSGSGGAGGINHIENSDAEVNTDGYATYLDAAADTPVDGTGGSPVSTTFTRSETDPLRDDASFLVTKAAANAQGEGVSYDFTIDRADRDRTLNISFDIDASAANYADADLRVFVYDVTNATLIQPSVLDIPANARFFNATFLSSDSTSYRLIFHVASTNAAAWTIKLDNIKVGPDDVAIGVPTEGWKAYTPTTQGWGTPTNVNVEYKRIGSAIQVRGYLTNGTASASELQIGLPAGLTIGGTTSADTMVAGHLYPDASRDDSFVLLATTGDSFFNVAFSIQTGASPNPLVPINGNNGFNSTERVAFSSDLIPVAEWEGSEAYLSQARPEYAYNSNTADLNDETSFAYGPSGVTTPVAITGNRRKRVRFLTPIQATDKIEVQFSQNGTTWQSVEADVYDNVTGSVLSARQRQGSTFYGMTFNRVDGSVTDIDVSFGRYPTVSGGAYGAASGNWSASLGFWRAVKIPGQVQVAYPTNDRFFRKVLASDFGSGQANGTVMFSFTTIPGRTYALDVQMEYNGSGQANFGVTLGSNNYSNTMNNDGSHHYHLTFVADSGTTNFEQFSTSGSWNIKGTVGITENSWAVIKELNATPEDSSLA